MVDAAARIPPLFAAMFISSAMYGPADALRPWPRLYGAKNTHPRPTYTGAIASNASLLSIPAALPWLYSTAGNGPVPSGLYSTPRSVIFPLGNDTISDLGRADENAGNNNARSESCTIPIIAAILSCTIRHFDGQSN